MKRLEEKKKLNSTSAPKFLRDSNSPETPEEIPSIFQLSAQVKLCTSRASPFVAGSVYLDNTIVHLTSEC